MKTKKSFGFLNRRIHNLDFAEEPVRGNARNALAPAVMAVILFLAIVGFTLVLVLRSGW
ncbi:MAG: hypothetical protein UY62_C0022G0013 [Parcubacteria group bacterium GW2011_GWF2_50_9]|nr:MAG: hypothetical protein UY62_C0022G0013 [Parcubacteria group bacterium GW2011_GWF2_50_9]